MNLAVFEDAGWRELLPLTWGRAVFELRCGIDALLDKALAAHGASPAAALPLALFVRSELAEVIAERYPQAAVRTGAIAAQGAASVAAAQSAASAAGAPAAHSAAGPAAAHRAAASAAHSAAASTVPPSSANSQQPVLFLNARLLLTAAPKLPAPSACWQDDVLLAAALPADRAARLTADDFLESGRLSDALRDVPRVEPAAALLQAATLIRYPWDLIARNAGELSRQIAALPALQVGRVDAGAFLLHVAGIRIASGARVKAGAVLDAEDGPIHIGANAVISPLVSVKGPCSIGDGTLVQPGAVIREGASIGPVCKVGGEIEGSIFAGWSNKQHDGFLGHSYVSPWVNLGADTVTSDLKNTYGSVTVAMGGRRIDSGQRFLGSIIGEHSKTGICTALTTGTVIGYCSNVVASRPPQFVPSFTWLTPDGSAAYDVDRAVAVARTVMGRRKRELSAAEERLMRWVAKEARKVEGG